VLKRIVKKLGVVLQGREGVDALVKSKIGEATAAGGSSSQLRRFYTLNYPALDRFDRFWYEMEFKPRPTQWESHFSWSLLHATVVNSRSVWCCAHEVRIPMREFLVNLINSFIDSAFPEL